jgi:hypothetical protein
MANSYGYAFENRMHPTPRETPPGSLPNASPKQDGTTESICLRCHAPVASSHNEYALEKAERTHV